MSSVPDSENVDFSQDNLECLSDEEESYMEDLLAAALPTAQEMFEEISAEELDALNQFKIDDKIFKRKSNDELLDYTFNMNSKMELSANALSPELLGEDLSPYNVFKLLFTDQLLEEFTTNTKNYIIFCLSKFNSKEDRKQFGQEITNSEIESFILCLFWMALDPKSSIEKYFATELPGSIRNEHKLKKVFTRDRFVYLLKRFHSSNAFEPSSKYDDKCIKIRNLIDYFNKQSPLFMIPGKFISSVLLDTYQSHCWQRMYQFILKKVIII